MGKIEYQTFTLENGLKVIVYEDHSIPKAVIDIVYRVGAKNEDEEKTGFAHLFEHLMFGGSKNIPFFDTALQKVGGDNNAFTNGIVKLVLEYASQAAEQLGKQADPDWRHVAENIPILLDDMQHQRVRIAPHHLRALERGDLGALPAGPFAVLPMTDAPDGTHRSSIVWTERDRLTRRGRKG